MEEEGNQVFLKKMYDDEEVQHQHWLAMVGDDDNFSDESRFSESSSMEGSTNSIASCSSSELAEDATSPTSSASSSSSLSTDHANGPLYELSELMAQLPIKRGLSKFYQGKSQSHTSLASVKSLEDLAKKGYHYKTKMKSSKSYAWGLDVQKSRISKNKGGSRGSVLSSLGKKAGSFVAVSSRDRLPSRINIC